VILDAVKIVIATLLLVVLQVSMMPQLMPTIRRGMIAAALAGFLGGVLLDAQSTQHIGLSSLLYVCVGVWVAMRVEPAEAIGPVPAPPPAVPPLLQFTYVIAGAAVVQIGMIVLQVMLGESTPVVFALTHVVLPTILETALVSLILLPLLRRLFPVQIRIDRAAAATA
jgi:hypothetical protein